MCVGVLNCMYVCVPCARLLPTEARVGIESPGTEITDSCEPSCGCWELNSCLLEEQQVLLTAEPSPPTMWVLGIKRGPSGL